MNGKWIEIDSFIFQALLIVIVISAGVAFLTILSLEGKHFGSAIYIKPGSYTGYSVGNKASFTYGIENNEGKDMNYLLRFVVRNEIIKKENIFVENGAVVEKEEIMDLGKEKDVPFKVRVILSSEYMGREVFFWIKGKK